MSEHCPTCGQPVTVVTSDEGTSHYEGAAAKQERERLVALAEEFALQSAASEDEFNADAYVARRIRAVLKESRPGYDGDGQPDASGY